MLNHLRYIRDHLLKKKNFGDWLKGEREARNWTQTGLGFRSDLSHETISNLESGIQRPTPDICLLLAKALRQSEVIIFRKAGLLPDNNIDEVTYEDWEYLLNQLPKNIQEELKREITEKIADRLR